jgi:hypothetical protein
MPNLEFKRRNLSNPYFLIVVIRMSNRLKLMANIAEDYDYGDNSDNNNNSTNSDSESDSGNNSNNSPKIPQEN